MSIAFPQGLPPLPPMPQLSIKDLNTVAWNASYDPLNDHNGLIKTDGELGTPLHTSPDGNIGSLPLSSISQYVQSMANSASSSFGSAGGLLGNGLGASPPGKK